MEDAHYVADPLWEASGERWGFFAVYDGHGGRPAVDYCVGKLHEVLRQELQSSPGDPSGALERGFLRVDDQLRLLGTWHNGTTATVGLIRQKSGSPATLH